MNIADGISVSCEDALQDDTIFVHSVGRVLGKAAWRTV